MTFSNINQNLAGSVHFEFARNVRGIDASRADVIHKTFASCRQELKGRRRLIKKLEADLGQ